MPKSLCSNEMRATEGRPYFSLVSRGEFSEVLNETNFSIHAVSQPNAASRGKPDKREIHKQTDSFLSPLSSRFRSKFLSKVPLISEDDFVALSLQALQGISSFLYKCDTIRQKQLSMCNFIVLGRSAASLSKYQLAFSESFYIRLLLGCAHEAFSTLSSDRGQLALGAALGNTRIVRTLATVRRNFEAHLHSHNAVHSETILICAPHATCLRHHITSHSGDILLLQDASISMLQEKIRNEERSSPTYLLTSVALHRSILSQLFRIIAPTELYESFQAVYSTPINPVEKGTDEKMNQFALLDLLINQYTKPHTWMSASRSNVGWVMLDSLLVHLEKARKMTSKTPCSNLDRCHSSRDAMGNTVEEREDPELSDSLAKVIVILFLVKRVSLPLLDLLQKRLFSLESDPEIVATDKLLEVVQQPALNDLDKITAYHTTVPKKDRCDTGGVLIFSTDVKNVRGSGKTTPLSAMSPMKGRYRMDSNGYYDSAHSSPVVRRQRSPSEFEYSDVFDDRWEGGAVGDGDAEGIGFLQGSVVPSLLLALDRAANPIRLISHAGNALLSNTNSDSSHIMQDTSKRNTNSDMMSAPHGLSAKSTDTAETTTSQARRLNSDSERCAKRDAVRCVLTACKDSSAQLRIPLNTKDLRTLDLLVESAMGRFTAIRKAVLNEIRAWVNPEPVYIDHKALRVSMRRKYRKRGRANVHALSGLGALLEEGEGRSEEETLTPRSDGEESCNSSMSDVLTATHGDAPTSASIANDGSPRELLSAALEMELNRMESSDIDTATNGGISSGVPVTDGGLLPKEAIDPTAVPMLMAEVEVGEVLADAVQLETTNRTEDVAVLSHSMEVEVEDEGKEEMPPKAMSSSPSSTTYIPSAAASVPLPYSLPLPVSSSAMRTDMSCLAHQLIHPDMRSIDREMRFRESVTSTYAKGLLSLATANGIVFAPKHTPSSSSSFTPSSSSTSFTPSSSSTSFTPSSSCSSSSTTGIGVQCASSGDWQRRYPPMNGNETGGGRESSGESEEDKAMMLLMQPMQALLDGTLLSAVSWQCRVLDQAALFASIRSGGTVEYAGSSSDGPSSAFTHHSAEMSGEGVNGRIGGRVSDCGSGNDRPEWGGLLWHIDSYEEAFLLSPKSDVISSLVSIVIETYAQRHPFSHSQSVFSTQRSRYLGSIKRRAARGELDDRECDGTISQMSVAFQTETHGHGRKGTSSSSGYANSNSGSSSIYGVEPTASMLDLWTEFSLKESLTKLKTRRPEAMESLSHVEYTITPIPPIVPGISPVDNSTRASLPSSSSSSSLSPSSDSIFSAYGLNRLKISYTAPWPVNTMITPALLRVTARSTRRLLELAQLTALVRFVWVDTRGRKNTSVMPEKRGSAKTATAVKGVPSSASSQSSYAAFDRDCSHALRIVQQTLLPLSDFTSDRIKSHQIKFRTDVLDASNYGFLGVTCALMRYAEGVAFSIFANEDLEDDDGMSGSSSPRSPRCVGSNADRARSALALDDSAFESDLSLADLISQTMKACRDVLIMLEMSSILRNEEDQRAKGSAASLLFQGSDSPKGPESRKHTLILTRIKDSITLLLQCRSDLFAAANRVALEEDQQDALALLMFFNE